MSFLVLIGKIPPVGHETGGVFKLFIILEYECTENTLMHCALVSSFNNYMYRPLLSCILS